MHDMKQRLLTTVFRFGHWWRGTCPHGRGCPPRFIDVVTMRGGNGAGGGC